jgi:hypothetical protein
MNLFLNLMINININFYFPEQIYDIKYSKKSNWVGVF